MIEALAAIALAGNVLEFTRFGIGLLHDARELYKSAKGSLSINDQLELVTADLQALVVKLRVRHPADKIEKSFETLLIETENVASQLLERLDGLKARSVKGRKWDSLRKAVQGAWTKDEMEDMTKKLSRLKDAVESHILYSILESLDENSFRNSARFDALDERTQLIMSSLLDNTIRTRKNTALVEGIHDQMGTLVQLVRRNDEIASDEHRRARKAIAERVAGDMNEITARFEMLDVSLAHEQKLRHDIDLEIIRNLAYPSMTERYENIIEAFPKTFDWVFEASTTVQPKWSNFSEWLKTGSGIYWIGGKAGSGKSTLMKHIYEDERTREHLETWAKVEDKSCNGGRQAPLCLATFFFWLSGTPEQKSQAGLLRALLFQILSHCPRLASVAFPEIWAKKYTSSIENLPYSFDQAFTSRRLKTALQRLAQQTQVTLKICFLIDGLDEFSGDHEELAAFFQLLSQSPTVKVCLSSRPWVVFEQIYGSRPSMRLQDLTERDISYYVNSKFDHNTAFRRLESSQPDLAVLLRDEVIEKAEGVFLWVRIVVKSLLVGIRNEDDVTILRQRVTAMPPKLEDLYRHLLRLIDPVYQIWASKAFQIVRAARDLANGNTLGLGYQTEGSTPLTICTLLFAITDSLRIHVDNSGDIHVIDKSPSSTTSNFKPIASVSIRCNATKTHLTARCAGILEVPKFDQKGSDAPIQFLHRTARDFLYGDETWDQILKYTKGSIFNPDRAVLKGTVVKLAFETNTGIVEKTKAHSKVTDAMLFAKQLQKQDRVAQEDILTLDNLDLVMMTWSSNKHHSRNPKHWAGRHIPNFLEISDDEAYLGFLALHGLTDYVDKKLSIMHQQLSAEIASKLLCLILPRQDWPAGVHFPPVQPKMVSTLLGRGANPNYSCGKPPHPRGPWSNVLWHVRNCSGQSVRVSPSYLRIMKLLVVAGARSSVQDYDADFVVRTHLMPRFEEEAAEILQAIADQKEKEDRSALHKDRGHLKKKQRLG